MDSRYYRILDYNDGTLDELRQFLTSLGLYHEKTVFEKSGGRDGDLGHEAMTYEMYVYGSNNGMNLGAIGLYSVFDNGANGYAQMLSVLVNLPPDYPKLDALSEHLRKRDFVTSHSSFRQRPHGFKHFLSYLDTWPALSQAFKIETAYSTGCAA